MQIDIAKLPTITEIIKEQERRAAIKCRGRFFYFVQEFWGIIIPEDPIWNWHIEYLCDELQELAIRVKNREEKLYDLIINVPPGSSKSSIVTQLFPAWTWTIDQTLRHISASYSASLSLDHAVKSRDVIKSDKYKRYFPEIQIKADQDNKSHYKNTANGERYATSVGGTITGMHAHIIEIDDPLNPKQAASDAELKTANEWMDGTLPTRKVDKSVTPTILVMQRLSENDPTGNWLSKKGMKIKHICLPGELSDNVQPSYLKEKYIDGLLDPIRLNKKVLNELSVVMGSYGYAGQIQQRPAPENGAIWNKLWFVPVPDNEMPPKHLMTDFATDWDLAYTEDEMNAANAYVTSGKYNSKMYVDDLGFDWLEFPDLMDYMKLRQSPHYIEAKASGKSAKQSLNKQGIAAIEIKVDGGDKVARTKMASPYAESGMICIRKSIFDKLLNDDRQGILKFPNGKFKDLNDAFVQAVQRHFLKSLAAPSVYFGKRK
jgi:hypothetical protein